MKRERSIRLERHAYDRYCQRVEPIGWQELETLLAEQLKRGFRRSKSYIEIAGVWYRATMSHEEIVFHTCYGRHHINLPKAIMWAKRFGDRIDLSGK